MKTSLLLKLLAATCVIYLAWTVISPFYAWKQTIKNLTDEAMSVTPLIDGVYEYRARTGRWPADLETVAPQTSQELVKRGWLYHCATPPMDGAQLETMDAVHTRLVYVFATEEAADPSPGWYCTSDGSPVAFSVRYEPKK